MNRYLLVFFLLNTPLFHTIAQRNDTIHVKLKPSISTSSLFIRYTTPTTIVNYKTDYVGIPAIDTFQISHLVINPFQYWYWLYKKGVRSKEEFYGKVKRFKIDTNSLTREDIKCYIGVFTAVNKNIKTVIVDSNNNHDFSDDTVYKSDTLTAEKNYRNDTIEQAPLIHVNYEYFHNKQIFNNTTLIRLKLYNSSYSYPDKLEGRLSVYTTEQTHREGTFICNDKIFKVSIIHSPESHIDEYKIPFVKIAEDESNYEAGTPSIVGETTSAGKHVFKIIDCDSSGTLLTLKFIGFQRNLVGGRVDNVIPEVKGVTYKKDSIDIRTYLQLGQYVLLDFWGSWCLPCLKSIPKIKLLAAKLNNKARIVGVDYEYLPSRYINAQKIVEVKKIDWPQVIESKDTKTINSFSKSFDVKDYPTLILISPEGTVLAREVGENADEKIIDLLKQHNLIR